MPIGIYLKYAKVIILKIIIPTSSKYATSCDAENSTDIDDKVIMYRYLFKECPVVVH